jgi:hypothetical protein
VKCGCLAFNRRGKEGVQRHGASPAGWHDLLWLGRGVARLSTNRKTNYGRGSS